MQVEKKKLAGILIVVTIALLPFFLQPAQPVLNPVTNAPAGLSSTSPRAVASTLPELKPRAEVKRQVQDLSRKVVRSYVKPFDSIPSQVAYRDAVAQDHHGTPRVLEGFAHEMAREMTKAKRNASDAAALFKRLKLCALDQAGEAIEPIRAVCAQNAAILAELYPERLETKFAHLFGGLDAKLKASLWR